MYVLMEMPFQMTIFSADYCMVSFVRPHLLGTTAEFSNMFVNPIQNGQYHDSDAEDVNLMKARSFVLHKTLTSCVQVSSRANGGTKLWSLVFLAFRHHNTHTVFARET